MAAKLILVDTSVWVDHLRGTETTPARWLDAGKVLAHPVVIGELALGNLPDRDSVLNGISKLPRANIATDAEVLHLIHREGLFGRG